VEVEAHSVSESATVSDSVLVMSPSSSAPAPGGGGGSPAEGTTVAASFAATSGIAVGDARSAAGASMDWAVVVSSAAEQATLAASVTTQTVRRPFVALMSESPVKSLAHSGADG